VSSYRIVIDGSLCSGFGACADLAPDLVELGPDGIAATRVGSSADPRVFELAATCPMAAIAIIDAATGEQAA
jgi:ferredoxin